MPLSCDHPFLRYDRPVSSNGLTPCAPLTWAPPLVRLHYPLFLRRRSTPSADRNSSLGRDALAASGIIPDEARITVSRESLNDVGFREIFVSIDGEQVGILRFGESLTTEVPSGPHQIRAHNTLFWKTHDVVLKPREHARFNAINRAGWGTFGMLFILGAMPVYLTFERAPADSYSTQLSDKP
jgi:hypothetical protein